MTRGYGAQSKLQRSQEMILLFFPFPKQWLIETIIFCHFSIIKHLGAGQFGTVSKGVWESHYGSIEVAVKMLQPRARKEEKVKFLQEAAIMGQFLHPNIVKLHGVVTVDQPVSSLSTLPPHHRTKQRIIVDSQSIREGSFYSVWDVLHAGCVWYLR